jgi:hypothetical protein
MPKKENNKVNGKENAPNQNEPITRFRHINAE